MFGWFNSKKKNEARPVSDDRINELIPAYGAVIESRTGGPRSVDELPGSKEELDFALCRAIELEADPTIRGHLRNGFIWLADFQVMSNEERAACVLHDAAINQIGDGSDRDLAGRAKVLNETTSVVERFSELGLAEAKERLALLNAKFGEA